MDKENNGKTNSGTLSPLIQFQKAQCTVLIPLLAILVPKTTPRTEGSWEEETQNATSHTPCDTTHLKQEKW